ncbi:hypothetical protein GCM10023235_73840 [Kitasatospora terrestris]|uniref:RNA polymerase subunit sigma-24 n=1 Tax=Kitasatospora terrestris TaxID=258051 RepID=A0ABP9ELV9_9ACTN
MIRGDSFAGRVLAVLSRRSPGLREPVSAPLAPQNAEVVLQARASSDTVAVVARAQAGDAAAFAALFDHHADTVYRYIYYRVGSRATAEDLTSETFLRALRRIGTFTWQGRDFGAWLVTIARNLVADHFKSSRFQLALTGSEALGSDAHGQDTALVESLQRLTPSQQECAALRFLGGLSVSETARITGRDEGAVRTLQYRAVRSLARQLSTGSPDRPRQDSLPAGASLRTALLERVVPAPVLGSAFDRLLVRHDSPVTDAELATSLLLSIVDQLREMGTRGPSPEPIWRSVMRAQLTAVFEQEWAGGGMWPRVPSQRGRRRR